MAKLEGLKIIDYGCGSGILAVAAVLLGAKCAWAVDIDPQALQATRDNARRNGVGQRIEALVPEALTVTGVDLLVANILANPLIDLAPRLAGLVRQGGRFALAGVLADQAGRVAAAFEPWFTLDPVQCRGEWARLTGRRTPAPVD